MGLSGRQFRLNEVIGWCLNLVRLVAFVRGVRERETWLSQACEHAARRQPSASQEESSPQNLAMLAP